MKASTTGRLWAFAAGALLVLCSLQHNLAVGQVIIPSTTTDANALRDALLGPGIVPIGNATLVGGPSSAGFFTGGSSSIGIESGIVLATGSASDAVGPNEPDDETDPNNVIFNENVSGDASGSGDAQLNTEFGVSTQDSTVLEFDFQTSGGNLFFNYAFASEEYNEFVNSQYNDVFAFFVNGVNVALIPGTSTPVAINNINNGNPFGSGGPNSHLFNNNDPSDSGGFLNEIEYDGFTNVFTASVLGLGPGTHHIKIAISDVGDSSYDSAVFLEATTFSDQSPSNPSFDDVTDENILSIDFGMFPFGSPPAPAVVSITNLSTGPNTVDLDLVSASGVGDTGILGINVSPFSDLMVGQSHAFQATVAPGAGPGVYTATYSLNFTDELGGLRVLTLNLSATVVPEPGSLACTAIALTAGFASRRRRK